MVLGVEPCPVKEQPVPWTAELSLYPITVFSNGLFAYQNSFTERMYLEGICQSL